MIKHSLTDSGERDLLQVLSLHCPTPNVCIISLYFWNFAGSQFPFQRCYYFSVSKKQQLVYFEQLCPNSSCRSTLPMSSRSYFVVISMQEQLRSLFRRPGFYRDLQYRFQHQKLQADNIEDVYDGKLYQALMLPGKFLTNPCNLSF